MLEAELPDYDGPDPLVVMAFWLACILFGVVAGLFVVYGLRL